MDFATLQKMTRMAMKGSMVIRKLSNGSMLDGKNASMLLNVRTRVTRANSRIKDEEYQLFSFWPCSLTCNKKP